jgi:hypothetical protein
MLRVVWRVRVRSGDKRARRAVVAGGVRPDPTLALTLLLRNASTRGRSARLSANETAPRGIFSLWILIELGISLKPVLDDDPERFKDCRKTPTRSRAI